MLRLATDRGIAVILCLLIYREQVAIRKSLHDLNGKLQRFFLEKDES